MKRILTTLLLAAAAFGAEGFHIINKIKIGGAAGFDYLYADGANHRLYTSHGTSVEIVDTESGKQIGTVGELRGVHGVVTVPELNKGFITNGQANNVVIFDLKTFAKVGEAATGTNPDAICYEPQTKRIFAFNGRSNDATAIDATTGQPVATFPVGPKPENCATDRAGKVYANIENSSEVVEIDAAKGTVLRRASLAPCEEPSGMAIDIKGKKLFSVCGNKMMAVTDIATMKVVATPAIGSGADGAGYDAGLGLAFSSNGGSGNLTIVKLVNGKYEAVDTVPTEPGARTITVDDVAHRVYLLATEVGAGPEAKDGQKAARPRPLPDSYHVIVVGK